MKTGLLCGLLFLAAMVSGCAPMMYERRTAAATDHAILAGLQGDVERLQQQVNDMEAGRQDLLQSLAADRAEMSREREDLRAKLTEVDALVAELRTSNGAMKQEIIDQLSKRMVEIMKGGSGSRSGSSGGGSRTSAGGGTRAPAGGREHVVESGQTLSQIATLYKVRPSAITEVNGLENPDALRVGQKLIIPE